MPKLNRDLLRKFAGALLFLGLGAWTVNRSNDWAFAPFYWLVVIRLFVVAGLFLYRAPAKVESSAWIQVAAIVSTFIPLLFTGDGSEPLIPYEYFTEAWILCSAGTLLGIWGFLALGKSFGVSPAVRERVTRGPYRFLKHPIYWGHVASDFGFLLMACSARNLAVVTVSTLFLIFRARVETAMLVTANPA